MSAPPQPSSQPYSDPVLLAQVACLEAQVREQKKQLASQRSELDYAQLKILVLEERLRKQRIEKYGKRSETLSDLQLELLDLEPGVSSEEVEAESQREPLAPAVNNAEATEQKAADRPRSKHPGRNGLPAHLKRVEQVIACTAEQCVCGQCGKETAVIGYEETEVLDVRPAEYFVSVIKREKRACTSCVKQGVATANVPVRIAPKSIFSDEVIIDFVVSKYCDASPLYRQRAILWRDLGIDVPLTTINDAVLRVGELLMPAVDLMKRDLLTGGYIQADETFVGVQTPDKKGQNHRAYCVLRMRPP